MPLLSPWLLIFHYVWMLSTCHVMMVLHDLGSFQSLQPISKASSFQTQNSFSQRNNESFPFLKKFWVSDTSLLFRFWVDECPKKLVNFPSLSLFNFYFFKFFISCLVLFYKISLLLCLLITLRLNPTNLVCIGIKMIVIIPNLVLVVILQQKN